MASLLVRLISVSYTHLDVYKRQVLCAVLQLAGPYIEINGHALSDETLAQSYLYGTVYSNSPAAGWFEQAENWL